MKKESGFTLIELLITLVILGILTSIALPSYQQYLQNGRRSEGQTALLDIAGRQEQFFLENHRYANDLSALGINNPFVTEHAWYSISSECDDAGDAFTCEDGYLLLALPQNAQAVDGNIAINSLGSKSGKW
ncbi:type IV pilin protein [Endozoicomonas ascidiicola]|uniref:type IV pilin protein n=1 Tax=Endozoicomonas ascidiicola TaxID=1698521 RepID=UPI00082C5B79|nr:type IV pilin protein [Endozoicomonas ascidiicola]